MSLQYEGPAVDAGTMDVRTLAPALIAVAEAMREAHVHLRISGPLPQVHVLATRPGSFIVDLLVADADTLAHRTIAILNSPLATADSSLVALVGTVIGSVNVVKRIRNRRINQVQAAGAAIVITLEDGTRIEAPSAEISLVSDVDYRRALQGMVEPLAADEGVNRLILSAGNQAATVTDDDLPAFDVPPAREEEVLREPPQVDPTAVPRSF
jgi:hypothetical protein